MKLMFVMSHVTSVVVIQRDMCKSVTGVRK